MIVFSRLAFTVLALMGGWSTGFAQSELQKNELGFEFGYHLTQVQDLVFSPMIYKGGSAANLKFSYRRITSGGEHFVMVNYDQADVEPPEMIEFQLSGGTRVREVSSVQFVDLIYGYAHRIIESDRFTLGLGGLINVQAHLMDYRLGLSEDEGYLIAYALSPVFRATYALDERQTLFAETSFPLFSFVSRPKYAIVDNEEIQNDGGFGYLNQQGEFEGPGNLVKMQLQLKYIRTLSERWDITGAYHFRYLKYDNPDRLAIVKNAFNVGITYKF